MQNITLKKEAIKAINDLSDEKVKVVKDLIDYLKEKEDIEATLEVLSSGEMMEQIREAEKALQKGKKGEFISWNKVKRNV